MSADKSLVIVEDDPAFSRTLARSFERRGYRVSVAESPEQLEQLGRLLGEVAENLR